MAGWAARFGQAKVPSSYWEGAGLWLWAVHSVCPCRSHPKLDLCTFCGEVMLLDRGRAGLGLAQQPTLAEVTASLPTHTTSALTAVTKITSAMSEHIPPAHPIQLCTSVLQLLPARPLCWTRLIYQSLGWGGYLQCDLTCAPLLRAAPAPKGQPWKSPPTYKCKLNTALNNK